MCFQWQARSRVWTGPRNAEETLDQVIGIIDDRELYPRRAGLPLI
jgi:hypothetical protein